MALSDSDFVRFVNREFLHRLPEDAAARLFALALRGAETQEEIERLRAALEQIKSLPGEINPSNYDHVKVCIAP